MQMVNRRISRCVIFSLVITLLLPIFVYTNRIDGDEYSSIKIGVVTGTVFDNDVTQDNPNAKIEYFNSTTDLLLALENGKIDGVCVDEPVARLVCNTYPNYYIAKKLTFDDYGIIVSKGNDILLGELSTYITKLKSSGKLEELQNIWFSIDENIKSIEFNNIANNEPVIKLAIDSSLQPFDYVSNGVYAGYEIALLVKFCEEYGYGLEIIDTNFTGVLSSVSAGKVDLGSACITINEERKQSINFSEPVYHGGSVIVKKKMEESDKIDSFEDLYNKNIGIQLGSSYDRHISRVISGANIEYFAFISDMGAALDSNKISGFVVDTPVAELFINESDNKYKILGALSDLTYGFALPKINPKSEKLTEELNAFLQKSKDRGLLDEVYNIWVGSDESKKVINLDELNGTNGEVVMAVSSTTGAPFSYVKNDQVVGYEIDLMCRFCKEYGYTLRVDDYSLNGLFTAIPSGRCDVGAGGIAITSERQETMYFANELIDGGCVVIIKNEDESSIKTGNSIIDSFYKTFIKEDRWKLFLSGICTTIAITVLSIIMGTILGFVLYILNRNSNKIGKTIINIVRSVIQKTPVVVILMILYYVIFGKINVASVFVSVVGFTLLFSFSTFGLIAMGVNSIDKGQMEAATALGYSENKAFIRVILPQAVNNVISGYKTAIITLIKDSAVVGYIAVQDLTKVGDIIRSRTYEAFFPLIATAIIYYLVATLFTFIVKRIEIKIDPVGRKSIPLLKGVKTK